MSELLDVWWVLAPLLAERGLKAYKTWRMRRALRELAHASAEFRRYLETDPTLRKLAGP